MLGAQKSCFSETVLLRTHNMCCGLVGRKVILHQALLSVCLVDVNQIYFSLLKPNIICFGCSKESIRWKILLRTHNMGCGLVKRKRDFSLHTLIVRSG